VATKGRRLLNQVRARREKQLGLPFRRWGGSRAGAGRKPNGARAGVTHCTRPALAARFPVHVTLRLRDDTPNLRGGRIYVALRTCLGAANRRAEDAGLGSVIHYSILRNHLHFIVEAQHREALSRGMQGLTTRLARAINRVSERSGAVFADRYHARILKTPREVRHALAYVLCNARRHGLGRGRIRENWIDPYSSGGVFDGWRVEIGLPAFAIPVSRARTWLLNRGWRRHGLLDPSVAPGPPAAPI
jgi:REP element-mobilizing transposase RayT